MNWYIVQAYSGFEKKVVENIKDELKKLKLFNGIPDNCRAGIMALGPGIEVSLILFFIQYCINLKPGSEISGDPASDIKTHFLLIKSSAILLITIFSL